MLIAAFLYRIISYFKQNGTKAVFGDAYNFLTTKEKDEKSRFIFFSPHPNLVTVLTHRADGGFLVAIYLLQLQRGGGAAQVVDVGIDREKVPRPSRFTL